MDHGSQRSGKPERSWQILTKHSQTLKIPKKILLRQDEITSDFIKLLDNHINDIEKGKVENMLEIKAFAKMLFIHPTHLSNTIKLTTGKAPCDLFEEKLMVITKKMLNNPKKSITDIAFNLTFDASNFTKWFKRFEGITPTQYRDNLWL
jgi:AraC family transcriptional regulator, regulatory protein of adaptative response / methylphosphotriester-DNA alkyltransferase methyltransferase